ncbi:hypothetical protein [Microbacterium invictum]|uniref:Phage tail protein n=1 Tax=Microbacterium invictum TaxID=515415 RepID=A0ABZ0VEB8_9MICO|nr:hypothetical protein [Microbacterium invictum]WQB71963.1 hypothetical protein T9R20_08470 [Microbacterium invictum]
MPLIANAAYFGTTGKLEIGTDEYTTSVTSCALVPNTPKAQVTDIGGGVVSFVGSAMWAAQITFKQDWATTNSLSQQLIAWHGTSKVFKYTPAAGGKVVTFTAICEAAQVGGGNNTVHEASVTLQIVGQPTFAAS